MQIRSAIRPEVLALLTALAVGCASAPSPDQDRNGDQGRTVQDKGPSDKAAKPGQTEAPRANARPKGPPDDAPPARQGGGGGGPLEDLARLENLKEQERKAIAENYYKTGKKLFDQLQYREAASNLEVSVKADPENAEARKLLDKTLWILGDRRGEVADMAREMAEARIVGIKQAQIEVERLFREGDLLMEKEQFGAAIERFERVTEAIRWFPYNVDRGDLMKRAKDSITQAKEARKAQAARHRAALQQAALEEAKAQKAQSLQYRNARLQSLYRRALEAVRTKRYVETEELCDRILETQPSNLQAAKLREIAIERRHAEERQRIFVEKVEHLKRQIEAVEESAVPYQTIFEYPEREVWMEIAKRELPIKDFFKRAVGPRSAIAINRRLASQKVDLNFDQTPFADCIEFLRSITGPQLRDLEQRPRHHRERWHDGEPEAEVDLAEERAEADPGHVERADLRHQRGRGPHHHHRGHRRDLVPRVLRSLRHHQHLLPTTPLRPSVCSDNSGGQGGNGAGPSMAMLFQDRR